MMKAFRLSGTVVTIIFMASTGFGREFHVDPAYRGEGDGSHDRPWSSLSDAIDAVKAGDTLNLRSGDYGILRIEGRRNDGVVTVAAAPGHRPGFLAIAVLDSSNWRLKGLFAGPAFSPGTLEGPIVRVAGSRGVLIEDSTVMSTNAPSSWNREDWVRLARIGVEAQGSAITLRGNSIRNVDHGLIVDADYSLVENNVIENFAGDGIRGLGDHSVYRQNTIKNCYRVDRNHDDGFQSWSRGVDGTPGKGEIVGVVLSGNRIINYEDPAQPFRCNLQGIGLFDGIFTDWLIANNIVVTDHWHGITVMGARNVRIVNNTVLDPNRNTVGPPWITITVHKDGRLPEASLIANNLATSFNNAVVRQSFPATAREVLQTHNMLIEDTGVHFVDAGRLDLRLRPASTAIDAGTADFAPPVDISGSRRPGGKAVDVGAFEAQ